MSVGYGDNAFRAESLKGKRREMTYGGSLSFLRRKYSRELEGVDIVVSGIPYDCASTHRPGSRLGPAAIRAASVQLAELDAFPYGFDPVDHLAIVDYGDCFIDPHHPDTVAQSIEDHARTIVASGAKMLSFGGDHFVSYPLLKAHAEKYGPVALVHVDAHCDTWPDSHSALDHGTMFARAAQEGIIDVSRSTQIGLRTFNDHDHGFEILTAPWVHRNGIDAALEVICARAADAPVYLSFDVDALDPAYAPGTGTPVVGGFATWQMLELIRGMEDLKFIGMDLVEVSPPFDQADITALAGASMAHTWLCLMALKNGAERRTIGRL